MTPLKLFRIKFLNLLQNFVIMKDEFHKENSGSFSRVTEPAEIGGGVNGPAEIRILSIFSANMRP
jgi:hypothetical protein